MAGRRDQFRDELADEIVTKAKGKDKSARGFDQPRAQFFDMFEERLKESI